ncbi:hypothetical protein [Caldanaerobius polysaccharolyticus]|uniref:hypothetical protein n=1 Tax=Caldanaerobius polysaccharolyticus TaxID=44256 RepID=UPI00047C8F6B|nr:hypothetical protein [Caldanaerobius polysaccharolyticus]
MSYAVLMTIIPYALAVAAVVNLIIDKAADISLQSAFTLSGIICVAALALLPDSYLGIYRLLKLIYNKNRERGE